MKKTLLSICLLLFFTIPASTQTVKLPAEVRGDPGGLTIVKAGTDCAELRWVVLDPGLSLIPPELLKDTKTAVVMSGRAGRYRLLAYGAIKDKVSDPAICVVVIGEMPPTPIPPDPGPLPSDPLFNQLQTVYRGIASEENHRLLKLLAAGYQQAARTARESQQPTADLMFADVREGFRRLMPSGEVVLPVRKLLEAELGKHVKPVVGMPLTDEVRAVYAKQFERYVVLLEAVKP